MTEINYDRIIRKKYRYLVTKEELEILLNEMYRKEASKKYAIAILIKSSFWGEMERNLLDFNRIKISEIKYLLRHYSEKFINTGSINCKNILADLKDNPNYLGNIDKHNFTRSLKTNCKKLGINKLGSKCFFK